MERIEKANRNRNFISFVTPRVVIRLKLKLVEKVLNLITTLGITKPIEFLFPYTRANKAHITQIS